MRDQIIHEVPESFEAIIQDTNAMGFNMASEPKTGALLKTLAASKPHGKFLEIGTGTGLATSWLLLGMDSHSTLISIDNDSKAQAVAIRHLGLDVRLSIVCADGDEWLEKNQDKRFDLIFADAWPGKFSNLEMALNLVNEGGMYVVDDLLPQKSWPNGHAPKVSALMKDVENRPGFTSVRLAWASGLLVVVKREALIIGSRLKGLRRTVDTRHQESDNHEN